jgi:hypothetical protein
VVFQVARNRPEGDELRSLSQAVAQLGIGHRRDLLARPFHDGDDAFDELADLARREPLLLVGLPSYLARWDDAASFRDDIGALFASDNAMLLSEGEFILATEDLLGRSGERLAERVLRTIATGH